MDSQEGLRRPDWAQPRFRVPLGFWYASKELRSRIEREVEPAAREWMALLTREQEISLRKYIKTYSQDINNSLRGKRSFRPRSMYHPHIERIDQALALAPELKHPLYVYRGERHHASLRTSSPEEALALAKRHYPVGSIMPVDPGFNSFSATTGHAVGFGRGDNPFSIRSMRQVPVLIGTRATRAFYTGIINRVSNEYDFLFPRGSSYKVLGHRMERVNSGKVKKRPALIIGVEWLGDSAS